ncbi:MAG: DNA-directed RNA polymerase subunit omega [Acidobacteriota bacterium]
MKRFEGIDSKFRFVIIAAKRSRELMKGSPAKINTKYKNPVKIAQEEISKGYIKYRTIEEDTI